MKASVEISSSDTTAENPLNALEIAATWNSPCGQKLRISQGMITQLLKHQEAILLTW